MNNLKGVMMKKFFCISVLVLFIFGCNCHMRKSTTSKATVKPTTTVVTKDTTSAKKDTSAVKAQDTKK